MHSNRPVHRTCVLLGLLVALAAPPAHAERAVAVVLLRTRSGMQRRVEDRTRDELRLMGIQVDEVSDPRDNEELGQILVEHGGLAALRIEDGGQQVVAWFPNSDNAAVVSQRFHVPPGDRSITALVAAETVRHRLLELKRRVLPSRDEPPSSSMTLDETPVSPTQPAVTVSPAPLTAAVMPEQPEATVPPAPATVPPAPATDDEPAGAGVRPGPTEGRGPGVSRGTWLGLTFAVAGGPGGARSLLGGTLNAGWQVTPILTVQTEVAALTTTVALADPKNTMNVGLGMAQVLGAFGLRGDRPVMPQLRIGGGPALVWATERTVTETGTAFGVAAVMTAGANLAIRVRARLRLTIGVSVHVLAPTTGAELSDTSKVPLGPPLVRADVGFTWSVPARGFGKKR